MSFRPVKSKAGRDRKFRVAVLVPKTPVRFPLTSMPPRLVKRLEEESRSNLAVFDRIDHIGRVYSFILHARNSGIIAWSASARPTTSPRITDFPLGH